MEYEDMTPVYSNGTAQFKVKIKEEGRAKKSPKQSVYDPEWETRPEFSWLTRCSYDPDYAYCILCKSKIQANLSTLKSHSNSKKHKQKIIGCIGTGKEGVMLQILYDNEATVEETEAPEDLRDVNLASDPFTEVKEPKPKRQRPSGLCYNTKKKHSVDNDWQAIKSEWSSGDKSTIGTPLKTVSTFRQTGGTEDEFAVFGRYIGNELRQVQDSFAQQTAKMKINTILFEALTGQYNRPQAQMPEVSQPYEIVVGPIGTPTTSTV